MGEYEVGQLAQRFVKHYTSNLAASTLLRQPTIEEALQRLERENVGPAPVPIGFIDRNDGTMRAYNLPLYLRTARNDMKFQNIDKRLGLEMAVVTLADAVERNRGFDRAPDLEFLRHLRNALAHGNRFKIRGKGPKRPAYFDNLSAIPTRFEITRALDGQPVLFDFLGPADVCDLLDKLAVRLIRIGNGDPPLPPYTSP